MDAVANYPQCATKGERSCPGRPGHFSHHYYALLIVLAAFGVLAFIFSAISPNDDDIQQEFFRSCKSKQCVPTNYKTVSTLRTFPICTVPSALASPTPQFASYNVRARVSVPDDEIKGRTCSTRTGDRSPPTKSS